MRTFGTLLVRGLAAGLLAGLLAGAFTYAVGEPHVDAAIAIEEAAAGSAHTHEPSEAGGDPLVGRDGQRAGLFLATALYGAALGGVLAIAYTLLRRRLRTRDDGYAALGLAAAGFLAVVLVPFLKYPANPPAVGDPETITRRTVSYLLTIVLGLLAVWAAAATTRRLSRDTSPGLLAVAAGVGAFVLTVVAAYLVLPAISEVPGDFPATLLWQFRLASLGTQAVLWLLLGFAFAALVNRRPLRPN